MRYSVEDHLYRFLCHPLSTSAGILMLGLALLFPQTLFLLSTPGFVLCFARLMLLIHRKPVCSWQPRKLPLRTMADCRSVLVGSELLLTGQMRIARVASPIALSKTLSIRSQSSSFLLATAAALTCPCITDQVMQSGIHYGLTALGVDPEKMQAQWRLLSLDAPAGFTGVTVRDGQGRRCFCCGDPEPMILSCGQLLTGNARPMEMDDRTELLRTLDGMRKAGGSVIAYAMLDDPSQPPEKAVFLGMLSLEAELAPNAMQELTTLSAEMDVFADFPGDVTPDPLRGIVHPSSLCPDTPLSLTLRPRRSACMTPAGGNTDGWAESCLRWRSWSLELLRRAQLALIALLPAMVMLPFLYSHAGGRSITLALMALLAFQYQQKDVPTPALSRRQMIIWPVVTLLLAVAFAFIGAAECGVMNFAPSIILCLFSGCSLQLVPLYQHGTSSWRRSIMIGGAVLFALLALCSLLITWYWSWAAAALVAGAWSLLAMHVLTKRIESRQ